MQIKVKTFDQTGALVHRFSYVNIEAKKGSAAKAICNLLKDEKFTDGDRIEIEVKDA